MSQRECAGFNWPPLSISAQEPVSISPEAVSRAGCKCIVMLVRVCPRVPRAIAPSPPDESPSCRSGDGHAASSATSFTGLLFLSAWLRLAPFQSLVVVVGHEPNPLSHVRRADTASRQTGMPDCVVDSFQVRLNKVEPPVPNRCFNLFAKDDRRAALLDEPEPMGP
jgi:hypothetical protein